MSRLSYEGRIKVWYVPTITNKDAPSMAQITAGVNLSPFIAKDGITLPNGQNMVDSATIEDTFDAQQVGSWGGGALTLVMFRDDTDESDAYDLIEYGLEGFLVISPFGAPAATKKVSVWPIEAHEPTLAPPAPNTMQRFTAAFAVTSAPAMRAVIVA